MSDVPAEGYRDVRSSLNRISERSGRILTRARSTNAARDALSPALRLTPLAPLVVLLAQGVSILAGGGGHVLALHWVVALAIGPTLIVLMLMICRAASRPVDRRDALAAVDRQLDTQDRLLAAESFLNEPRRDAFMNAAIEDVQRFLAAAIDASPQFDPKPWRISRSGRATSVAAVLLIVLSAWLSRVEARPPLPVGGIAISAPVAVPRELSSRDDDRDDAETPDARKQSERELRLASTQIRRRNSFSPVAQELPDDVKQAHGRLGTGQAAETESAGSPSSARGAPSSQGQPAKAAPRKPKAERKPKPKRDAEDDRRKTPDTEEQNPSGATAGQGASRASSRNPAVSDWASRDHVAAPDEEESEPEEDVEDEDESEDSRGGVQANLRDRKPPVNRDLRIGFGTRRSPDANGRGGPSAQKKSRGVASLVLGVPIPDRVKGQPNPGRTKVTQQRIEPQREETEPLAAGDRAARSSPTGPISRPEISPWLARIVRNYFLNIRQRDAADQEEPTEP